MFLTPATYGAALQSLAFCSLSVLSSLSRWLFFFSYILDLFSIGRSLQMCMKKHRFDLLSKWKVDVARAV